LCVSVFDDSARTAEVVPNKVFQRMSQMLSLCIVILRRALVKIFEVRRHGEFPPETCSTSTLANGTFRPFARPDLKALVAHDQCHPSHQVTMPVICCTVDSNITVYSLGASCPKLHNLHDSVKHPTSSVSSSQAYCRRSDPVKSRASRKEAGGSCRLALQPRGGATRVFVESCGKQ